MYGTSTVYPVSGGGHRAARKERESSVFKNDLFCTNYSQHEPVAVPPLGVARRYGTPVSTDKSIDLELGLQGAILESS